MSPISSPTQGFREFLSEMLSQVACTFDDVGNEYCLGPVMILRSL